MPIPNAAKLYSISFALPDGEHIATFRTDATGDVLKQHIKQFFDQNQDAKYDVAQLKETTPDEVVADREKLRNKNPDRVLADEVGLDTPNRIMTDRSITNPAVVAAQ